jgi:flagellar L-ring protein precursor FlgH
MNRIGLRFIAGLAALTAAAMSYGQVPPDAENPGSLFPKDYRNPLADRIARREGDLLTIIISESSLASFNASTTTSKKDQNSVSQILAPTLFKRLLPNLGTGANSSTSGQGATQQAGRLSARMTAVVKQVLPNGVLVIEGFRQVRVNKDTQTFLLSGMVRQDDVTAMNTVMSENIAEATIKVDGKGQISDRTRRGILTRIIDWLF